MDDDFGYQTFVSPSDPYRYEKDDKHILDFDGYHKPKIFREIPDINLEHLELSLYPGRAIYQDPEVVIKDYEEYQALISAVVSRHLCEVAPLEIIRFGFSRFAVKMRDIEGRLSRDIKDKARGCNVRMRRSMPKHNRYIFEVKSRGGQGIHTVTVKANATDRRIENLDKADLKLACSCPFWIYYGPEYHARRGGYLEGNAKGTATPPRIRDPKGTNVVCKHVYAVFDVVGNYMYRW